MIFTEYFNAIALGKVLGFNASACSLSLQLVGIKSPYSYLNNSPGF